MPYQRRTTVTPHATTTPPIVIAPPIEIPLSPPRVTQTTGKWVLRWTRSGEVYYLKILSPFHTQWERSKSFTSYDRVLASLRQLYQLPAREDNIRYYPNGTTINVPDHSQLTLISDTGQEERVVESILTIPEWSDIRVRMREVAQSASASQSAVNSLSSSSSISEEVYDDSDEEDFESDDEDD